MWPHPQYAAVSFPRDHCHLHLETGGSRLVETRGKPAVLITDNGREFAGRALDAWAYAQGIRRHLIEPGKPNQNAYVESFNGRAAENGPYVSCALNAPLAVTQLAYPLWPQVGPQPFVKNPAECPLRSSRFAGHESGPLG